jgi:hypothetical protein
LCVNNTDLQKQNKKMIRSEEQPHELTCQKDFLVLVRTAGVDFLWGVFRPPGENFQGIEIYRSEEN